MGQYERPPGACDGSALDRRTRRDADLRILDLDDWFADEFPSLPERQRLAAGRAVDYLEAPPLTIDNGSSAWTICSESGMLRARRGTSDGAVHVILDAAQSSDWIQQQATFSAFRTSGALRVVNGRKRDFDAWDAIWLALLEEWPVDPGELSFTDRKGDDLDLEKIFTPQDDVREIAHFFREAGFLHLRGWIESEVVAEIADDIDRALPSYHEGDGRSWWAGIGDGGRRCVRLQHFIDYSPATIALLTSNRWSEIRCAIAGSDQLLAPAVFGNCIEALVKPLGVVTGISDVPWHRDCNFGRHAYQCAQVVVGISADPGDLDRGQLRVVAGSHRVNMPASRVSNDSYLPIVAVPTDRGDLTVHQSCTLHESTPPLSVDGRRVLYTGFSLPIREDAPAIPAVQRQKLLQLREEAHLLQSQPRSPAANDRRQSVVPRVGGD